MVSIAVISSIILSIVSIIFYLNIDIPKLTLDKMELKVCGSPGVSDFLSSELAVRVRGKLIN